MGVESNRPWMSEADQSLFRYVVPRDVFIARRNRAILQNDRGDGVGPRVLEMHAGYGVGLSMEDYSSESLLSADRARFFADCRAKGISSLLVIPNVSYKQDSPECEKFETSKFSPPLVGKIKTDDLNAYDKVLNSMLRYFSGSTWFMSMDLRAAMLDREGHYVMYVGPEAFVKDILGVGAKDSWRQVDAMGDFDEATALKLTKAELGY